MPTYTILLKYMLLVFKELSQFDALFQVPTAYVLVEK